MDSEKKRNTIALIDSAKSGKSLDEILKQIKAARKLDQILLPRMGVMSNELLANMVGCSRAYVYGIMKGSKHPEKDMLLRIAFALGMGVDETQEIQHKKPCLKKRNSILSSSTAFGRFFLCLLKGDTNVRRIW